MTHVRTSSVLSAKSNGKLGTLGTEASSGNVSVLLRSIHLTTRDGGLRIMSIDYNRGQRLHSAIGYVTPADKLNGLEEIIFC